MSDDYVRVFKGKPGSYLEHPRGENDQILAGLSYFHWIVALVALVGVKPQSPFLRFHAIQAILLQIATFVFVMASVILMYFLVGCLLLPFAVAMSVYGLVIMILVISGRDHRVPFIADYVEANFI